MVDQDADWRRQCGTSPIRTEGEERQLDEIRSSSSKTQANLDPSSVESFSQNASTLLFPPDGEPKYRDLQPQLEQEQQATLETALKSSYADDITYEFEKYSGKLTHASVDELQKSDTRKRNATVTNGNLSQISPKGGDPCQVHVKEGCPKNSKVHEKKGCCVKKFEELLKIAGGVDIDEYVIKDLENRAAEASKSGLNKFRIVQGELRYICSWCKEDKCCTKFRSIENSKFAKFESSKNSKRLGADNYAVIKHLGSCAGVSPSVQTFIKQRKRRIASARKTSSPVVLSHENFKKIAEGLGRYSRYFAAMSKVVQTIAIEAKSLPTKVKYEFEVKKKALQGQKSRKRSSMANVSSVEDINGHQASKRHHVASQASNKCAQF
eukprot:jgi/Bigna1/131042/aug1.13_g5750